MCACTICKTETFKHCFFYSKKLSWDLTCTRVYFHAIVCHKLGKNIFFDDFTTALSDHTTYYQLKFQTCFATGLISYRISKLPLHCTGFLGRLAHKSIHMVKLDDFWFRREYRFWKFEISKQLIFCYYKRSDVLVTNIV